ncbi:type II and III secretion system protein family protein [Parasulfitobacter algicola]|uniref:Type II and III secretion system protein family protein n=1 Tax=Parasulfitobacter algicola TaxID=2614809 RepID=A0ABX2IY09_9RHOB|nr:type II and III secretion system protein family protein [Sulfitobacter algicola]NSX56002.1 type II and III secretion system protein family protein [Sulfitobacter algicola]
MKYTNAIKAALLGFAVTVATIPTGVNAETLRIMRGAPSSALNVPMNRAVVVESDVPFAELSIANPGIADISTLSDRTIYVLGKEPGRTTLTLLGGDGRLISNIDVHVAPDIGEFKERLRQILPGENIEVRTANDGIVLSGTVSSIARLDRALDLANRYAPDRVSNLMMVGGTQQVMLKVRFAEMQRTASKALGSRLNIFGGGLEGFGVNGVGDLVPRVDPDSVDNRGVLGGGAIQEATSSVGLTFGIGDYEVAWILEALEQKGLVRTLAEPNLVALSGQEATFLAGGEYPVAVAQDDETITVEFKPFGVELNFIPRVVDGDTINLSLEAAVSSIDPSVSFRADVDGIEIFGFRRRETSTTVEMRDGESFAIAGLLEDDFSNTATQTPWLGDVPILGSLFRSASFERGQSELVIIITPHLVTPTRGEALALPTDRVTLPTEGEFFINGRMQGRLRGSAEAEVAKQDFNGSYGYVMD